MAEKQLDSTVAAAAFQKEWFADLRRRVFDQRQPYALLQADVPFELFELYERVTWLSLGALTLNLAIVAFMLYRLFHAGGKKIANIRSSSR